jgi:ribosomal subunit interface protein
MKLNWTLFAKRMRPHAQMKNKLQDKISKLEKHIEHFPEDAVHLQVSLERHPKKLMFDAILTLKLPSNVLRAQKSGSDPVPAFDQAIKALLREVALLKSNLRREKDWQSSARRNFLHMPMAVAESPGAVARAF